jgi:signal transduction histidine kinase
MTKFNKNGDKWLKTMNTCLKKIIENRNNNINNVCIEILEEVLNITNSDIGFMAELKYTKTGRPFFRSHAVHWKTITESFKNYYKTHFIDNNELDFNDMNTLYGLVYQTNDIIISNDVINDKRRGGMSKFPEGHPLVTRFMGIPIKNKDNLIGIIGLANAPQDYDLTNMIYIEPFVLLFSFVISEWKKQTAIDGSRNNFLLQMSHEIKTPLNGIIGMTQHLLDTELTTEQLDIMDCISQCNLRLLTIINDIGDFYKISMGHIELNKKAVNLKNIIKEVYELYRTDIEQKKLIFRCNIDTKITGDIISDKKRLTQILINLLSNAIKYTHNGSIEINIDIDDERTQKLNDNQSIICFKVKDTGIGISKTDMEVIFHDFQNFDSGLVIDINTGRGLGLSICRLLSKAFGGDIIIDSIIGKGTTVIIYIKSELSDNTNLLKDYIKEKINDSYGMILVENEKDRIMLSNILISIGVVPIIPFNDIEARMYIDKMNLNFSLLIVSEKYLFVQIIVDAQAKFNNITVIGISNLKKSTIMDAHVGINFTDSDIIKSIYNACKNYALNFDDINQNPENIITLHQSNNIKDVEYEDKNGFVINHQTNDHTDNHTDMDSLYKGSSYLYNSLSSEYLDGNDSIRILIAEDEIGNQKVIKTVLVKLGFNNIDIVSDGQLMCQYANKQDYDVILIDIKMPIMDGYTASAIVIKKLKEQNRPIPVMIAVTALEDMYMKERCDKVGIHYVLKKPFSFLDLFKIMKIVKQKKIIS